MLSYRLPRNWNSISTVFMQCSVFSFSFFIFHFLQTIVDTMPRRMTIQQHKTITTMAGQLKVWQTSECSLFSSLLSLLLIFFLDVFLSLIQQDCMKCLYCFNRAELTKYIWRSEMLGMFHHQYGNKFQLCNQERVLFLFLVCSLILFFLKQIHRARKC